MIKLKERAIKEEFGNTIFESVAVGSAYELLRHDLMEHLREIQSEMHFKYLRFHGLFHDDMEIVRRAPDGTLSYQWHHMDKITDNMLSVGLKPFFELNSMPQPLASAETYACFWKMNTSEPKDYNEWGDLVWHFVSHMVDRYGLDEVKTWYFEVWNEFNHTDNKSKPGYTTQTYANILTRAYRAVKRANPDAVVFLGGLCRVGSPLDEDYEWLNELLPKITGENMCFDAVSIHPYRYSSPEDGLFRETITAFKEYLTSKGLGDVPLWISEMGWPSFRNTWTNITEKDQAEYLVRMLAINDAYSLADRVIWYDLENDGTLKTDNESNFGLLNNKAHIPAANSAKPSYLAYANYNAMTYGYTPCGGEERENGTLVSMYENNGDTLYICQNASSDVSINVSDFSNDGLVYVYDIFGNAVEFENTVSVGKSPIYIEVKSANLTLTKKSENESVIRAEIADKQFTDICGGSAMLIVKQTEADERLANIYVSSDFKKVDSEYSTQIKIGSSRDSDINAYLWGGINKMIPLVKPLTK